MKKLWMLVCSILLVACATATNGEAFNAQKLSKLQVGVSTLQQTIDLLGGVPQVSRSVSDGGQLYQWQYIRANSNGFIGTTDMTIQIATLQFDADGKFRRITRLQGVMLPPEDARRLMAK